MHATDPTNASRTLLMDLHTLEWDDELLDAMAIPRALLPEIRSSSEVYGTGGRRPGRRARRRASSATSRRRCSVTRASTTATSKNTYGTGAFLLFTLGTEPVISEHGLITTVAWKLGDAEPVYALEGSVAMAGALVQWLRDNLGLIDDAPEVEQLARSVADSGGVVFVPAFSGLFAPYWRDDARGRDRGPHAVREQRPHRPRGARGRRRTRPTTSSRRCSPTPGCAKLGELRVDGGMTKNDLLMQFQADILGAPVVAPAVAEITATGAAYAAGLATGFWSGLDELRANYTITRRWQPEMDGDERARGVADWRRGIDRTMGLVEPKPASGAA